MPDRKADRHSPERQVPVSARLDRGDFDLLEHHRKALGISRRQAIINALRAWLDKHDVRNGETGETIMTPEGQDAAIRMMGAGQPPGLVGRLEKAEAELDLIAEQARAAYRVYRDLEARQNAKAAEVKELRLQIREEAARGK